MLLDGSSLHLLRQTLNPFQHKTVAQLPTTRHSYSMPKQITPLAHKIIITQASYVSDMWRRRGEFFLCVPSKRAFN